MALTREGKFPHILPGKKFTISHTQAVVQTYTDPWGAKLFIQTIGWAGQPLV